MSTGHHRHQDQEGQGAHGDRKELQMRIKEIRDGNGSWAEKFGLIDEVILDAQERAGVSEYEK